MAIKITIEQTGREIYVVKENVVAERIPTDKTEPEEYGNKVKRCYHEKYQIQEVEKVNSWSRELLRQTIEDDEKFDLAAVIRAINAL